MTIPTSAQDWINQTDGEVVRLPSGMSASLRNVDVLDLLLEDGSVPDILIQLAAGAQGGFEAMSPQQQIEMLNQMKPFLDRLCRASFVAPRLGETDDPESNQIAVSRVSIVDKLFIFREKFGGLQALAGAFPAQPDGDVVTPQSSEDLRAAAKQSFRDSPG